MRASLRPVNRVNHDRDSVWREPEETMTTAERKLGSRTPSLKPMSHVGSSGQ